MEIPFGQFPNDFIIDGLFRRTRVSNTTDKDFIRRAGRNVKGHIYTHVRQECGMFTNAYVVLVLEPGVRWPFRCDDTITIYSPACYNSVITADRSYTEERLASSREIWRCAAIITDAPLYATSANLFSGNISLLSSLPN